MGRCRPLCHVCFFLPVLLFYCTFCLLSVTASPKREPIVLQDARDRILLRPRTEGGYVPIALDRAHERGVTPESGHPSDNGVNLGLEHDATPAPRRRSSRDR